MRASAGLRSFRRRPTLEEALRVARQQVERTARQEDGAESARGGARVDAVLAEMPTDDFVDGGYVTPLRVRSLEKVHTWVL